MEAGGLQTEKHLSSQGSPRVSSESGTRTDLKLSCRDTSHSTALKECWLDPEHVPPL